jgi:hypothetical protein
MNKKIIVMFGVLVAMFPLQQPHLTLSPRMYHQMNRSFCAWAA